jgi:hypothetical protein
MKKNIAMANFDYLQTVLDCKNSDGRNNNEISIMPSKITQALKKFYKCHAPYSIQVLLPNLSIDDNTITMVDLLFQSNTTELDRESLVVHV